MAVRRKRRCPFKHAHLVDFACRSVSEFLTGALVTHELFRASTACDYDPIRIENCGAPVLRKMLLDKYPLEDIVWHPDYHRIEPLPGLVLNWHIDHC